MNMNNIDKQKLIEAIISSTGGKIDSQRINDAASSGDISSLISALPEEDKRKLNAALSDQNSIRQLLQSPQARALLSAFMKGGKNNKS